MRAKLFKFPILIVMLLLINSCSDSGTINGKPRIGAAVYKFDDTFMSYVRRAIEKNANGSALLELVDSQNSQPIQNDQIDQFLSRQVKSMAINPVDRTAAEAIIIKAMVRNTPIVFFNREPLPEDMKKWDRVYYVGANAGESGRMQGEILAHYWNTHPEADKNNDGMMQYIMIKGEPGHQDAELRTEYSLTALIEAGIKPDKLAEDTAYWDRPKAFEKMKTYLAKFGDKPEAVICNNDDMALGAIEALKQDGYFSGSKYMPVVGVDATPPAMQALAQGTLLGTVLNDAENQGKAVFDIAFALASGKSPESTKWTITDGKYIWVPYRKVIREARQEKKDP